MLTYSKNRVTRIQTPQGLAYALSFHDGVKNTMVQLIELNNPKMREISLALEDVVKFSKKFFTRINHGHNEYPKDTLLAHELVQNLTTIKFKLKVQSFSNIDDPLVFDVDMENYTFKPAVASSGNHEDESINSKLPSEFDSSDTVDDKINSDVSGKELDFIFCKTRGSNITHNLRMKSIIDIKRELSQNILSTNDDNDYLSSDDEDYVSESSSEDDSDEYSFSKSCVTHSNLRHYGPPPEQDYNEDRMICGVKVVKLQEFGNISPFMNRAKIITRDIEHKTPIRKDSYAKAVRYAKQIISSTDYFHDSNEEIDSLHNLASDFTPQ